ncbi:hypothetical protein BHM03_00042128 [Ensete ventricosum]|nr:hypothetical protein BHM03_00042128 [Ensete ventricosum]
MKDRLHTLFMEFRLGQSLSLRRSQHSESFDHKEDPTKTKEQVTDSSCLRTRVDFRRWEDGNLTGWISRTEQYFLYNRILEASMVDIAAIHLRREAAQWYNCRHLARVRLIRRWYGRPGTVRPTWRRSISESSFSPPWSAGSFGCGLDFISEESRKGSGGARKRKPPNSFPGEGS